MLTFSLKQWGNSQAIRIPASVIQQMNLNGETEVQGELIDGKLILSAKPKPVRQRKYTLEELLAGYPPEELELSDEDREWLNMKPVGKEEL